jgi:outer membrane biosynthesis protein TonB
MVSKTSITLVGAQPRPQGVVLRFELVLTKGTVLVRGEGRVVGFKPNAYKGVGGLTLRFTRIDAKSKGLLDKATSLREQRRPSSKPPKELVLPEPVAAEPTPPEPAAPPPPQAEVAPPPPASAPPSDPPPPAPVPIAPPSAPSIDVDLADMLEPDAVPAPAAAPLAPSPAAAQPPQPPAPEIGDAGASAKPPESPIYAAGSPTPAEPSSKRGIDVNPDRDSLLERLRARAKGLGTDGVRRILDQKRNGTG